MLSESRDLVIDALTSTEMFINIVLQMQKNISPEAEHILLKAFIFQCIMKKNLKNLHKEKEVLKLVRGSRQS